MLLLTMMSHLRGRFFAYSVGSGGGPMSGGLGALAVVAAASACDLGSFGSFASLGVRFCRLLPGISAAAC